jgi:hypothetical protein
MSRPELVAEGLVPQAVLAAQVGPTREIESRTQTPWALGTAGLDEASGGKEPKETDSAAEHCDHATGCR